MSELKLSPYQRIVRNAKLGIGVVLTADEVSLLARDDAIEEVALNQDEEDAAR